MRLEQQVPVAISPFARDEISQSRENPSLGY